MFVEEVDREAPDLVPKLPTGLVRDSTRLVAQLNRLGHKVPAARDRNELVYNRGNSRLSGGRGGTGGQNNPLCLLSFLRQEALRALFVGVHQIIDERRRVICPIL